MYLTGSVLRDAARLSIDVLLEPPAPLRRLLAFLEEEMFVLCWRMTLWRFFRRVLEPAGVLAAASKFSFYEEVSLNIDLAVFPFGLPLPLRSGVRSFSFRDYAASGVR